MKGQVVSGVKWTTLGTVVLAVAAILKISVLARYLDRADFGLMALVTLVMGFMNLFNDMGLTSAILHKQDIDKKQYASLYWFNAMVSIAMYFLLLLVTPLIASFYDEPQLNQLIPLLGLNLLLSGVGRMFKTIENKHLLFKNVTIIDIIAAILSLALAIVLAIKGYGVYSLVYSALAQYIVSNSLLLALGLKNYGLMLHYKFAETLPFLKIGIYQVGGQTVNFFNRDLDILIIGKFFSAETLGSYSLARELIRKPVVILSPIISKVGAPVLARANNEVEKLKKQYLELVNIVSSLAIPVYTITIIIAPILVSVFYGDGFSEVVIFVRILSINMMFRMGAGVVGNLVVATGRTDLDFVWNIFTLVITPVFVFAGVWLGSVVWVAIMVTAASVFLFVPSWYFYVRKLLNVSLLEYSKAFFIIKRIKISNAWN